MPITSTPNPAPSYELNWNYRRKYILEHVLKDGGLQQVEHQGDFVFLHYLSEEYGASQARITQEQYVELRYDEGWTETVLDSVGHVITEPAVERRPNIQAELAEAIKNIATELNVTVVIPESPIAEFVKDPPPHVPGEPYILDHIGLIQQEYLTPSALAVSMMHDAAELLDAAPIMEAYAQQLDPENAHFVKQVEALAAVDGIDLSITIPVEEKRSKRNPKYDDTGQLTPEAKQEREKRLVLRKQEAAAARELKKNPPLPKLPVLEKHEPLVLPTLKQLLDFGSALTPEYFAVSGGATTSKEWYVGRNSSGGGDESLWMAILNYGYPDNKYYRIASALNWQAIHGDNFLTNQPLKPEVVISTATGFFIGRMLGVVLTHRQNGEVPTSAGINEFLNGELNSQFTPDTVLSILSRLWPDTHSNIRDRFELHMRLLNQIMAVQRLTVPNPYNGTVNTQRELIQNKIDLIDGCKRICWYVNTAEPSGYGFMKGLLQPERMFHSRQESFLLGQLLQYTGKIR